MDFIIKYEEPIWAIIGAFIGSIIGFLLFLVYEYIKQKKQYKLKLITYINNLIRIIYLKDSKYMIRKLSEILPQFKDKEKIYILAEIGMQSSFSSKNDDLTQIIIDEFRFICNDYEVQNLRNKMSYPFAKMYYFNKNYKEDEESIKNIHNSIYGIIMNIIEYCQSENLIESALILIGIINIYSINRGYENIIKLSIDLYEYIGISSIGLEYENFGYEFEDFKYGIDKSINELNLLKNYINKYIFFDKNKKSEFSRLIDNAINVIKLKFVSKQII